VDPRWRAVAVVFGRAVAFELVEPVEGDVEAVAALILHHRHFHGRRADRDGLDAAIDADAVVEVDDVVALHQRAGGRRRCGLPVPARPAQPPRATKDLVVGEDPQSGHQESAVERAHHERRVRRQAPPLLEQFIEPLDLSLVVAEDDGGWRAGEQVAQAIHLAVNPLRRQEPELELRVPGHEAEARQRLHPRAHLGGCFENFLAFGDILTQSPRDLEMMGRLAPGPLDFVVDRSRRIEQEERV
jgi:hypothetical protein